MALAPWNHVFLRVVVISLTKNEGIQELSTRNDAAVKLPRPKQDVSHEAQSVY